MKWKKWKKCRNLWVGVEDVLLWLSVRNEGLNKKLETTTLPETNMDTHKGPYEDYSPSKRGLYGFPCYFGGVYITADYRTQGRVPVRSHSSSKPFF